MPFIPPMRGIVAAHAAAAIASSALANSTSGSVAGEDARLPLPHGRVPAVVYSS
jgi:hypothetical protein